jgi:hypothetical protein
MLITICVDGAEDWTGGSRRDSVEHSATGGREGTEQVGIGDEGGSSMTGEVARFVTSARSAWVMESDNGG